MELKAMLSCLTWVKVTKTMLLCQAISSTMPTSLRNENIIYIIRTLSTRPAYKRTGPCLSTHLALSSSISQRRTTTKKSTSSLSCNGSRLTLWTRCLSWSAMCSFTYQGSSTIALIKLACKAINRCWLVKSWMLMQLQSNRTNFMTKRAGCMIK